MQATDQLSFTRAQARKNYHSNNLLGVSWAVAAEADVGVSIVDTDGEYDLLRDAMAVGVTFMAADIETPLDKLGDEIFPVRMFFISLSLASADGSLPEKF